MERAPCPVCLELLASTPRVARTPCGHRFCMGCLDRWADAAASCPLCRAPVPKTVLLQHHRHPVPAGEISGWVGRLGSDINAPAVAPVVALGAGDAASLWCWLCRTAAPGRCRWTADRLVTLSDAADASVLTANTASVRVGGSLLLRAHFLICQAWVHDVCVWARELNLARYPVHLGPAVMDLFVATLARSQTPPLRYQAILAAAIHHAALQLRCLVQADSHRGFVRSQYPDAIPEELDRAEAAVRPLRAAVPVPFATLKNRAGGAETTEDGAT